MAGSAPLKEEDSITEVVALSATIRLQHSSVQDGIYALGKARMRSTLFRSFPPTLLLKQF